MASNDFTAKEVIDFLHEVTGIPKGGKFTYGIEGRLKEVVNERFKEVRKVDSLENVKIYHKDIKGFIAMLDNEIGIKNTNHQKMNDKRLENFTNELTEAIKSRETNL